MASPSWRRGPWTPWRSPRAIWSLWTRETCAWAPRASWRWAPGGAMASSAPTPKSARAREGAFFPPFFLSSFEPLPPFSLSRACSLFFVSVQKLIQALRTPAREVGPGRGRRRHRLPGSGRLVSSQRRPQRHVVVVLRHGSLEPVRGQRSEVRRQDQLL
jgi:hypothetical protein